jgi:hypothetical protein
MSKPPVRKLQVFISSTFLDLRNERQSAVAAILENGHIPAGMELFAAGDEEQIQVIQRWIDESDVFMLILGRRYGSVEPKRGSSYTQLEYDYALTAIKPFFAIVLSDQFVNEKIRVGASAEDLFERSEAQKFDAFREIVTSRMCKFVDDHKDIRLAVAQSIRELERRHDFTGWISARQAETSAQIVRDLASATQMAAALQERNTLLEKELSQAKKAAATRTEFGGKTFQELFSILKAQETTVTNDIGGQQKTDLLTALFTHKARLAVGVTNGGGAGRLEVSLFYNVSSPLLVYSLAQFDKVPASVMWQRLVLSPIGRQFLTELELFLLKHVPPEAKAIGEAATVSAAAIPVEKSVPSSSKTPRPSKTPGKKRKPKSHG